MIYRMSRKYRDRGEILLGLCGETRKNLRWKRFCKSQLIISSVKFFNQDDPLRCYVLYIIKGKKLWPLATLT